MIGKRESILILEADIDLQYLSGILYDENYSVDIERNTETFISKCKNKKYSAFVLCSNENSVVDKGIIDVISGSLNIFTPVLVVCPGLTSPLSDEIAKYKYELIAFPFSQVEFQFRIRKIIRQKQNEESVHNNLLRFSSLFDSFPLGIVQSDQHGEFIGANTAFRKIMGMTETELYKENFFKLCHPDDYLIERKQLDRLLRKEVDSVSYETRLINNDGVTCVCKIIVNSTWDSEATFSHFTFVLDKII